MIRLHGSEYLIIFLIFFLNLGLNLFVTINTINTWTLTNALFFFFFKLLPYYYPNHYLIYMYVYNKILSSNYEIRDRLLNVENLIYYRNYEGGSLTVDVGWWL